MERRIRPDLNAVSYAAQIRDNVKEGELVLILGRRSFETDGKPILGVFGEVVEGLAKRKGSSNRRPAGRTVSPYIVYPQQNHVLSVTVLPTGEQYPLFIPVDSPQRVELHGWKFGTSIRYAGEIYVGVDEICAQLEHMNYGVHARAIKSWNMSKSG